MTIEPLAEKWQDLGWNGLAFQLPATWQPTVIYPDYLFFEQEGAPAFEIKWQNIRGHFSVDKAMDQIKGSLKKNTHIDHWDLPSDFQQYISSYTVSGMKFQHDNSTTYALVLYCPKCKRATLLQWYIDTDQERERIARIIGSFSDHNDGAEQLWSIYDIKVWLPPDAILTSHDFLPGRYTLCFDHKESVINLYRFKPATVLLEKKSISEFGKQFLNSPPQDEGNGWAAWQESVEGVSLLLAKMRRKPVCYWMRFWHDPDQNVILGVKAEGKRLTGTGWLDKLCNSYESISSH